MDFEFHATFVLSFLLVATRLAAMFAVTPVLGFPTLPGNIRVLMVLVLAATLSAAQAFPPGAVNESAGGLALGMAREAVLGAAMGFGIAVCFAGLQLAGRLFDYQVGFAAALLFDPATKSRAPLFGTVLSLLGAVLFLEMDGHHAMLRALAWSMAAAPPGLAVDAKWLELVVAQFGLLFVYGFVLVAPSIVALMIVDAAVAVSARTMPQVNAYFVALPAKVFTGILVLALSLRVSEPLVTDMFSSALRLATPPVGP